MADPMGMPAPPAGKAFDNLYFVGRPGSWPAVSTATSLPISSRVRSGPDLFRNACLMGLEGMVSKHRESTNRGGRFRHWIKVTNQQHPAFSRVQDPF
jgi:hypothetical protein